MLIEFMLFSIETQNKFVYCLFTKTLLYLHMSKIHARLHARAMKIDQFMLSMSISCEWLCGAHNYRNAVCRCDSRRTMSPLLRSLLLLLVYLVLVAYSLCECHIKQGTTNSHTERKVRHASIHMHRHTHTESELHTKSSAVCYARLLVR